MKSIKNQKTNIVEKTFKFNSEKLPTIKDYSKVILFDDFEWTKDIKNSSVSMVNTFEIRQVYCRFNFAILSHEWITDLVNYLKQFKKVIELSCGAGWLTHWIRKYGYNIHSCVDNLSWGHDFSYCQWVDDKDSIQYVKDNQDTDLFILSWPYMDNVAFKIWNKMKPGQILLYIGEGCGGCTANDDFFSITEKYEIDSSILNNNFKSFCGIHDRPRLFKKE